MLLRCRRSAMRRVKLPTAAEDNVEGCVIETTDELTNSLTGRVQECP